MSSSARSRAQIPAWTPHERPSTGPSSTFLKATAAPIPAVAHLTIEAVARVPRHALNLRCLPSRRLSRLPYEPPYIFPPDSPRPRLRRVSAPFGGTGASGGTGGSCPQPPHLGRCPG